MVCILACLLLTPPQAVQAQTKTVTGTVIDATSKLPLVGAAVTLKANSTIGTSTSTDGTFSIKAKPTDVLVCSYFGYVTQEVAVSTRTAIDFAMKEDTKAIDEVVVVGYGTLKKAQVVGAVENLDGKALAGRTSPNISRTLQGQVPGLNITQVDGKPNHSGAIYIRGGATNFAQRTSITSATGKNYEVSPSSQGALVLIDGVEGDLSSVNSSDVEKVAVLKDAASTAVYGSRGAYGVILVTTKRPSGDKVSVSYDGSFAINRRTVLWENNIVSDSYTWAQQFAEFFQNDARTPGAAGKYPNAVNNMSGTFSPEYLEELGRRSADGYKDKYAVDPDTGSYLYYGNTNWLSMFYKKYSSTHTHNITVNASSKRVSYMISGRYYDQGTIYKVGDEKFRQYNMRQKGTVRITDWLTLENNTSFFKRRYHQPMMSSGGNVLRQMEHRGQPMYTPYNEDGTPTYYGAATGYVQFVDGTTYQEDNKMSFTTKTSLAASIVKDVLKVEGDFTYRADRSQWQRVSQKVMVSQAPGAWSEYNSSGYKSDSRYVTDYMAANAFATWTPKFGENHQLNVVAGYNIEKTEYRSQYVQRKGLYIDENRPSYDLIDGDEFATESGGYNKGTVGVFGRINYTLLGRYIVEFAARYDGSSLFPSNSQWGFFPSGSVGWRVSEEPWMKWSENWLSNMKIRGNIGQSGNANINPYYFIESMSADKSSILFDGQKISYVGSASIVPSGLTWETVTTYDIGLDMDFLKNRLSFSGDYYWRYTDDMICGGPSQPNLFGASTPKGNYGSMKTTGWELALTWRDSFKLAGKDFAYSVKGSVWDSRSWIREYYNLAGNIFDFYNGKELGEIWGFRTDGYFMSNEEADNWATDKFHKNGSNFREYAGDIKFVDINGDGKIDTGKGTIDDHGDLDRIGNMAPRYYYGFNLAANWNGIGISVFIQGIGKRDWYPDDDSGFFWGMYNRPYGYLMKNQTGNNAVNIDYTTANWRVTNASAKPYWTRQVTYAANRNVGPLAWANTYYLQDASYVRVKNITIDYTFPTKLTKKWHIEKLKVYLSGDNLFTHSPIYKHTDMFDPEVITNGDSDFSTTSGLSGIGQGYSYPMLKTYTIGLNITF